MRTCLAQAGIPLSYWPDALEHVVKCKNVVPHGSTHAIPYQVLFATTSLYLKHLKPFGCNALFAPVVKKLSKLSPRLEEGICLGHVQGSIDNVLSNSKDVQTKQIGLLENIGNEMPNEACNDMPEDVSEDSDLDLRQFLDGNYEKRLSNTASNSAKNQNVTRGSVNSDEASEFVDALTYVPEELSKHGQDCEKGSQSGAGTTDENADTTVTVETNHTYNLRPRNNMATVLPRAISTDEEPSLKLALKSPERAYWIQAIKEEFDLLLSTNTWVECHERPGELILAGLILRLKRNEKREPTRFKARLVASGNFQKDNAASCADKYAPVAGFELARFLLALSVTLGWTKHHIDIKGAILYAKLPASLRIWVKLPKIEGIEGATGQIVRLLKSLYGLQEAPKL